MYRVIASGPGCSNGTCPTIWDDRPAQGDDDVFVQGYTLTPEEAARFAAETGVTIPAGETIVRLPRSIVIQVKG